MIGEPRNLVFIQKDLILFGNSKTDDEKVNKMAGKIKPFVAPAFKTEKGYILTDANHRAKAVIKAGFTHIPCALLTKEEYDHVKYSENRIDIQVIPQQNPEFINSL